MFTCSNNAKSKATLLVKVLACDGHSSSIQESTAYSCLKESTRLLEGNYTNPLANCTVICFNVIIKHECFHRCQLTVLSFSTRFPFQIYSTNTSFSYYVQFKYAIFYLFKGFHLNFLFSTNVPISINVPPRMITGIYHSSTLNSAANVSTLT